MKILKHVLTAASVGALLALPGAAMATPAPNYFGPTGYIFTPNAEVLGGSCINAGYHWFDLTRSPAPNVSSGYVNAGMPLLTRGNFLNGLEMGGTLLFFHAQPVPNQRLFPNRHLINGKLSLIGGQSPFQMAVGVFDGFDELFRTAYVVGQLDLSRFAGLPFIPEGLVIGAGGGQGNQLSPLKGMWLNGRFSPVNYTEVHGEWMSNQGLFNVGVRVRPTGMFRGLALDFSALNVTEVTGNSWSPAVGASYTYCFGWDNGGNSDDDGGDEQASARSGSRVARTSGGAPQAGARRSSALRERR